MERDGCGKMRFENLYSFISGISWIRFHVFDTTFKYSYIDRNVLLHRKFLVLPQTNNINFPKYVFDFVIISSKDRRRCLCVA